MLRWTITFLIIALVAALFGFGGIAAGAASIAKVLFFIFLVLFVLSLVFGASIFKRWWESLEKSWPVSQDFLFKSILMTPSRIQKHPRQEDKTGRPSYASTTKVNFSTTDPRTNNEGSSPKGRKIKFIRIRSRKQK